MSIATFESPQVASQQFFPWVFDEDAECGFSDAELVQDYDLGTEDVCPLPAASAVLPSEALYQSRQNDRAASEARIGSPVRLGAVMIKLLKSYGITDAEIAEGMAAYAANADLAKAG